MPDYFIRDGDNYVPAGVKLVPESDLMAVKGSSETAQNQLKSQVNDLTTKLDTMTVRATSAESAVETVKAELEPLKVTATRVGELEQQLKETTDKHSAVETQLLTTKRETLATKYSLKPEVKAKLDSMNAEQLNTFEENASLLGMTPNPQQQQNNGNPQRQNFDRGNGSNLVTGEKSAFQSIRDAVAELPVTSGGGSSSS